MIVIKKLNELCTRVNEIAIKKEKRKRIKIIIPYKDFIKEFNNILIRNNSFIEDDELKACLLYLLNQFKFQYKNKEKDLSFCFI